MNRKRKKDKTTPLGSSKTGSSKSFSTRGFTLETGAEPKAAKEELDTSAIYTIGQTASTLANKFFAPDSIKQGNNATGDLISKGLDVIYYVDRVKNIEEIAKIYETYGYKVDRVVNGSPITKNRTLYNYVQCSEIELDITMLSSDIIVNDLSDRFLDGLRLWNVVEMENNNLNLGDVCVYDNIEISQEVTNE